MTKLMRGIHTEDMGNGNINITISRVPSWNLLSEILGEWKNIQNGKETMSVLRASKIAGLCLAAASAKRRGLTMPKDWKQCHPSLPYQMDAHAKTILESELVTCYNTQHTIWLEL